MAPPPLRAGTQLNNQYRIIRVLGQGGFGIVYLGETFNGQQVAIKQNTQTDQDSRDQFKREADLVRPLNHNHLVHVQDYFEDIIGTQFLVMDYISGSDLLEMAEKSKTPFSEKAVVQWGVLLCDVLVYLHSRTPPVIHRDIKPQNIKIESNGRLVLVDFGIAKELHAGQKTQRGARGATPGFSPLEQYGQTKDGTDARTDVYALGATLYFLLTRQMPDEAMERVQTQAQLDARQHNRAVSDATAHAIIRATQIAPANRYASASEFKRDLERALLALGVSVPQSQLSAPLTQPGIACPHCGAINRGAARRCAQCGNSLTGTIVPQHAPLNQPGVTCPHCGYINRGTARRCAQCGRPLAGPSIPQRAPLPPMPQPRAPSMPVPSIKPSAPSPSRVTPTQEQAIVGWSLFAMGIVGIGVSIFQAVQGWVSPFTFLLIGLSILSLLAGRDVNDLFSSIKNDAPAWLGFVFDTSNRGRQWGTVAALAWIVIGVATSWLLLPLAIAAGMVYVLNILLSKRFVEHVGGYYAREGWVTVIGWLLIVSGVGTVPGIALLIPKRWAIAWSQRALGAIALGSIGSTIFAVSNWSAPILPASWVAVFPGTPIRPLLFAIIALSLVALIGAIVAIQYLEKVNLNFTQTAMRRELIVTGWVLLVLGIGVVLGSFAEMSQPVIGSLFWIGTLIGILALSGARDLLDLGARWFTTNPPWIGEPELGRRKGIIAAVAIAILAALTAWQIVPLAYLALSIFIVRELMSAQSILVCGGKLDAPSGVTLVAWLMVPTGVGTVPGIMMLKGDARGWQLARFALAVLGFAGLAGVLFVALNFLSGTVADSIPVRMAVTGSIAVALSAGLALGYIQSSIVRRYFGV